MASTSENLMSRKWRRKWVSVPSASRASWCRRNRAFSKSSMVASTVLASARRRCSARRSTASTVACKEGRRTEHVLTRAPLQPAEQVKTHRIERSRVGRSRSCSDPCFAVAFALSRAHLRVVRGALGQDARPVPRRGFGRLRLLRRATQSGPNSELIAAASQRRRERVITSEYRGRSIALGSNSGG